MLFAYLVYAAYLIIYAVVSYAIIYNINRYRLPNDKSGAVVTAYAVLSVAIIGGSIIVLFFP